MTEPCGPPNPTPKASHHIGVVIADDHPIVRAGVRNKLELQSDIKVLGEAADGDETLSQVRALEPDVLVLDINMPGLKAVQVIHRLKAQPHPPRILILTVEGDIECVVSMLKAGATGYLLKDENPDVISAGVRAIAKGEYWLSKTVLASLVEYVIEGESKRQGTQLTPREMEVLHLVAQGWDNAQIAEILTISEGTVKNYMTILYDKLDVHSRAELVAHTWQTGLASKS